MRQSRYDAGVPKIDRSALWLAVLLMGASAGCSRSDDAPPVATVAVTPSRTELPIGSPLHLTYQFTVASGASINGDYKVFVHLLNADEQNLWSDDHDPAIPTSQWKPGQTIRYERTGFLPPATLQPGQVTLHVGLYKDGERLPLATAQGAESPQRSYAVATLNLAPESENIFLIYKSGWHLDEFGSSGSRSSWKWTEKDAVLSFRNPKADSTLLLEFDARPDVFTDGPQHIRVFAAGPDPVATFTADSDDVRMERIPLTAAQLGTADMAEIRIETDKVFVPAELPTGGRDMRSLGIRVYNTFVERR